jgi:hypothetical protein
MTTHTLSATTELFQLTSPHHNVVRQNVSGTIDAAVDAALIVRATTEADISGRGLMAGIVHRVGRICKLFAIATA